MHQVHQVLVGLPVGETYRGSQKNRINNSDSNSRCKSLFFDYESSDQVSVLCDAIQDRIGLPAQVQRLVHRGKVLNASNSFAFYDIQHADNIQVMLEIKGGMPFNADGMYFCDNGCVSY